MNGEIPDDRQLTSMERGLVQWLIEHGSGPTQTYLEQLDGIRVISRCGCGCASVKFDLDGRGWNSKGGMGIVADYQWTDGKKHLFGIYVFAKAGTLAGLEVWSIDGQADAPSDLPGPEELTPLFDGS